jgi:hypothetical protein
MVNTIYGSKILTAPLYIITYDPINKKVIVTQVK